MSMKNSDDFYDFAHLLPSWEDRARLVDFSLRRIRARAKAPILNLGQLEDPPLSRDEAKLIRTIYDRFSTGLKDVPSTGRARPARRNAPRHQDRAK